MATYTGYSINDADLHEWQTDYAAAHDDASAGAIREINNMYIGQYLYLLYYNIDRAFVIFDTSSIPSNAIISAATLSLYGYKDESDPDFDITIQNGQPTYPHDPVLHADYLHSHYSGNGGTFNTSGFSTAGYNDIVMNADGRGWIQKGAGAKTKLCLRSSRDINSNMPADGDEIREYVRVFRYTKGTGYKPKLVVTYTVPPEAPTVTNGVGASSIEETTARLNGEVTDNGGENPTVHIYWGETDGVTTPGSWDHDENLGIKGEGTFFKDISGLTPGKKYYYRCYATNSAGSDWADSTSSFTTKPNAPANLHDTAQTSSSISLAWTKGTGAEKTMIRYKIGSYPASPTDGSQGYFNTGASCTVSPLARNTTYYFRAWSYTEAMGYSDAYSEDTAITKAEAPTVTTQPVSNIGDIGATGHSTITDNGGEDCSERGVCWNTTGNPTTADSKSAETNSFGIGEFTRLMTGLTPGQKYYVKGYAINSIGTSYGGEVSFTTKPSAPSSLTATTISETQINLAWTKGAGAVNTVIRRKVNSAPTSVTDGVEVYNGPGTSHNDTTCSPGNHYYYRAWSYHTTSGYSDSYDTADSSTVTMPAGTTEAATLLGDVNATLNGKVTDDGGEPCVVRFQYGTTAAYGTNTAWQTGKVTDDTFSQRITGLTPLTGYHFRAQIKNSAGTANGADKTFTTITLPTPFLRRVLRDTFGGGFDISAANPLQVYDPSIAPVEDSVSDTTTNAWADALDLDYRGVKAGSFEIENTDGANSLDYKVLERVADYASGDDEELQASFTLAFGEKAKVNLEYAHSRIKIQVIDTVALSHATYTIRYLLNK